MRKVKICKNNVAIAITLVIAIVIVCCVCICGGTESEYGRNIDLGQKYLEKLKYEQAIASFEKAVEIDPMQTDAYIGMTDAYIGMGDMVMAIEILEKAIKIFDENGLEAILLKKKLDEVLSERMYEKESNGDEICTISIKPLLDELDNVWGRNWLEWTLEEFVSTFNLEESEPYYTESGEVLRFWDNGMVWEPGIYYHVSESSCGRIILSSDLNYYAENDEIESWGDNKSLVLESNGVNFTQIIKAENKKVEEDGFFVFSSNSGINSVHDVISYYGLEEIVQGNVKKNTFEVNTEYGKAQILYECEENANYEKERLLITNIKDLPISLEFFEYKNVDIPYFAFSSFHSNRY